jgi:hypothetical protein
MDKIPKAKVGPKFCNNANDAGNIINCPRDALDIAIPIEILLFSGVTDLLIAPKIGNVTPDIPIPKMPDAMTNPVLVERNPIKNKPRE